MSDGLSRECRSREREESANREIGDPRYARSSGGSNGPRGWFSRGYLPHCDGDSVIQHVTVHLADSLPKSAIEKIESSLAML